MSRKSKRNDRNRNRSRQLRRAAVALAVLAVVGGGLAYYKHIQTFRTRVRKLTAEVESSLAELGFAREAQSIRQGSFPYFLATRSITLRIPFAFPLDRLSERLRQSVDASDGSAVRIEEQSLPAEYQLRARITLDQVEIYQLDFLLKKARIALLLDDFGYSNDGVTDTFLQELNVPLTVSVIPGTPYAHIVAQKAAQGNKEVMVHLPMEPQGAFENDYRWIILKDMRGEEIQRYVQEALQEIPQARGLNNHMGSLVTTREEEMRPLLEAIRREGIYFVDSRTSSDSIAFDLAREMGIPAAKNACFLDNKKDLTYIAGRLDEMIGSLDAGCEMVAIGHHDPITAEALRRFFRKLNRRKIEPVYVSQLTH